MRNKNLTILFLLCFSIARAQYFPDAGRISPLSENATFIASGGENLSFAHDNNINTYWESESVLPDNYISMPRMNNLAEKIQQSVVRYMSKAFDYNTNTKVEINEKQADAKFRMTIPLVSPSHFMMLSSKLQLIDTVKLFVETTQNFHLITQFLPTDNYQIESVDLIDYEQIISISLVSNSAFDVFEIAAMDRLPTVFIEVDFHQIVEIGQIYTRHMCGKNIVKSEIQISTDKTYWKKIADLEPQAIAMLPIILQKPEEARYLRLVHTLDMSSYAKATIWELKVYDRYGPYGKAEVMLPNNKIMRERIGINGFWGWGFNTNAENIPSQEGASKYNRIGNLARSYHNMNWDIIKPGDKADYDEMTRKGTKVHDWLNWDKEYSSWKQAGFSIDASIHFQQLTFSDSLWKNPFEDAYQYGIDFGNHFGNKMQLIDIVEVGNEPWDYPTGFYNQILSGMSAGIRASKSEIKVFPAAFQATFKAFEKYEYDNYIGSKLDATSLKNLDGINGHFYSHTFDEQGNRISVFPEDQRSELHGVRNLSKFRNSNLPNKPLIITEFGYDSYGGGETCDHPECVTEMQQAAWGLRAALFLLRNNADAVYWYFFANENRNSVLHSRSGLCSSAGKSFIPKMSFHVFAEFQQLLGDCVLKEVLNESPEIYCYLFENKYDKSLFAVIWSTTDLNPEIKTKIRYRFSSEVIAINYLDDNEDWIETEKPNREQDVFINGFPAIVRLK